MFSLCSFIVLCILLLGKNVNQQAAQLHQDVHLYRTSVFASVQRVQALL